MRADVPVTHAETAEAVRSHLVALRGGAPFLSPNDSALLVRWLDEGVAVSHILRGLEIAAEKRRRKRNRMPLTLSNAKRHVAAPRTRATKASDPDVHPLEALAATCATLALHRHLPMLSQLGDTLLTLPTHDSEELARAAIRQVGQTFAEMWKNLPPDESSIYHQRARCDLGDVAAMLDEGRLVNLLEEHARGLFREDHPGLDATRILREVLP